MKGFAYWPALVSIWPPILFNPTVIPPILRASLYLKSNLNICFDYRLWNQELKQQGHQEKVVSGFFSSVLKISKKKNIYIYKFFVNTFCFSSGWIEETFIEHYENSKIKYLSKCNSTIFRKSVEKIEEYIINKGVSCSV